MFNLKRWLSTKTCIYDMNKQTYILSIVKERRILLSKLITYHVINVERHDNSCDE